MQSQNCCGGYNELTAAVQCVRAVFPNCVVIPNRVSSLSGRVVVDVKHDGKRVEVWSGEQENLCSSRQSRRVRTMEELKMNLQLLKEVM